MDIYYSFPAAIGPVLLVSKIRARFAFIRPTRRCDDGKSDRASAAFTFGGNRYTSSGVTGSIGNRGVAASARIQAARPACDCPGGGSGIYCERYFFTNPDTSPGTIGGRGGHSLRSDCARGAATSARASSGGGLGTGIGIPWTATATRHFSGYLEFVGAFFLDRLFPCVAASLRVSPGLLHRGKRAFW